MEHPWLSKNSRPELGGFPKLSMPFSPITYIHTAVARGLKKKRRDMGARTANQDGKEKEDQGGWGGGGCPAVVSSGVWRELVAIFNLASGAVGCSHRRKQHLSLQWRPVQSVRRLFADV